MVRERAIRMLVGKDSQATCSTLFKNVDILTLLSGCILEVSNFVLEQRNRDFNLINPVFIIP